MADTLQSQERLNLYDNFVNVNSVDPSLYEKYPVKRGLRNNDGSGVIAVSPISLMYMVI